MDTKRDATLTPRQVEIHERRLRVLQLRVRHLTEQQIATALNVHESTISKDLKFIYHEWQDRYGVEPSVDPAVIVGEAMALFQEGERLALLEMNKLVNEPGPVGSRSRLFALKLANEMKDRQLNLLHDLGILHNALHRIDIDLPQAVNIRRLLKDVTVTEAMLTAPAERAGTSNQSAY